MTNATDELVRVLKALADPIRMRIVALCRHGECSVSELTRVLSHSQPRISQHLRQLCDAELLERFRDGQFAYYRVPLRTGHAAAHRRLLGLLPDGEPAFQKDVERLRKLRATGEAAAVSAAADADTRRLHRGLVELTVAAPLGDLLDIGCGHGRVLKLLASRAHRAVGVDIDADARQFARAELLVAGVENASLRQGTMYELPFADREFDTVVLDDVLGDADEPLAVVREAGRLVKPTGRLLLLATVDGDSAGKTAGCFADWCRDADLRLASPRRIPRRNPHWLLAVATPAGAESAAA